MPTPFGRVLEELRRKRGLRQNHLAEALGISACYVSAMETGRKNPGDLQIIDKIISTLNLGPADQKKIRDAALASRFTRKLPPETSEEEFILVHKLWKKLGTLNAHQITLISTVLEINNLAKGGDMND